MDALLEGMFNRFGTPEVNHTDQQLRIPCPQLAILTAIQQQDWLAHVPLVLIAYRTAAQDSTACSPALLMLGREIRTPVKMVGGQAARCLPGNPGSGVHQEAPGSPGIHT